MSITQEFFGKMPDGRAVYRYVLQSEGAMTVAILNYGGAIQQITVPDREGKMADVVCGFDSLEGYLRDTSHHGALVGRFANRIAGACFTLDGVEYHLAANNGKEHIHGGLLGFGRRLWEATAIEGDEPSLRLQYLSVDGEEGYPGNLNVTVTYTLKRDRRLTIHYQATTDQKTVVNLTNHSYFNLGGFASGDILDQELWLDAESYLPLNERMIPTGEVAAVAGTPFDFRAEKPIGRDMDFTHPHVKIMNGYDTPFLFRGGAQEKPVLRAVAYDPDSGREMKMYTTQSVVQLYTANGMNKENCFKGGIPQVARTAFCLEAQGAPDSMHFEHFLSPILHPGETYDHTTEFAFSVRE